MLWHRIPDREWTHDLMKKERTSVNWANLTLQPFKIFAIYTLTNSGHLTTSENEWNRRNTTKLVFPSLCPLKSRGEDFKNGFQIYQFRLNFNGTKTWFAEIFHTDIHEAQIFEIRGFRSTFKRFFFGVTLDSRWSVCCRRTQHQSFHFWCCRRRTQHQSWIRIGSLASLDEYCSTVQGLRAHIRTNMPYTSTLEGQRVWMCWEERKKGALNKY